MSWFITFILASCLVGVLIKDQDSRWAGPMLFLIACLTAIGYYYFRRI